MDDRKFHRRLLAGGVAIWSLAFTVMALFWGVVIWGIITLVNHFT